MRWVLFWCQLDLFSVRVFHSKHPGFFRQIHTPCTPAKYTPESWDGVYFFCCCWFFGVVVVAVVVEVAGEGSHFMPAERHQAQKPCIRLQNQIYLTILFNHFLSLQKNIDRMYKLGQNHPETNRNYHASPSPFHQGPYFLKWRSVLFPFSRSKASIGWLVSLEVRLFRRIFRPIGGFPHLAHKGLPKISVTGWWGRSPHVWRCFKDGRWGFAQSTHFFGMALQVLNAPFSVFIILHSWPQNS